MKITLCIAMSLDQKIADVHNSTEWISTEDNAHLKSLIKNNDVLIMGRKTYDACKNKIQLRYNKQRIVISSNVAYLENVASKKFIEFTNKTPSNIISNLPRNSNILILGGNQIYKLFLENNLVDAIYLTIESIILKSGVEIIPELIELPNFNLKSSEIVNKKGTVIKYYEKKS